MSQLFTFYSSIFGQRRYLYDAKEIVFFSLQKTIEATLNQKVTELDKEEAMEISLQLLEKYKHNRERLI